MKLRKMLGICALLLGSHTQASISRQDFRSQLENKIENTQLENKIIENLDKYSDREQKKYSWAQLENKLIEHLNEYSHSEQKKYLWVGGVEAPSDNQRNFVHCIIPDEKGKQNGAIRVEIYEKIDLHDENVIKKNAIDGIDSINYERRPDVNTFLLSDSVRIKDGAVRIYGFPGKLVPKDNSVEFSILYLNNQTKTQSEPFHIAYVALSMQTGEQKYLGETEHDIPTEDGIVYAVISRNLSWPAQKYDRLIAYLINKEGIKGFSSINVSEEKK